MTIYHHTKFIIHQLVCKTYCFWNERTENEKSFDKAKDKNIDKSIGRISDETRFNM